MNSTNKNEKTKPTLDKGVVSSSYAPKPLDKYIDLIEKEFPKYYPIDYDKNIAFKNDAVIFRNDTTFCYAELADTHHITGQVFVSVFRSNGNNFEEMQADYLDQSTTFSFDNIESFTHWINAVL